MVSLGLGVILVGDDPASKSYVKAKEKAAKVSVFFLMIIGFPHQFHKVNY